MDQASYATENILSESSKQETNSNVLYILNFSVECEFGCQHTYTESVKYFCMCELT